MVIVPAGVDSRLRGVLHRRQLMILRFGRVSTSSGWVWHFVGEAIHSVMRMIRLSRRVIRRLPECFIVSLASSVV